ncbi:tail fiber protein [Flavobacteriaceae bacterium S0862]|nr:tail fiber protein [Flavobacteriaceae bacterium S0862]
MKKQITIICIALMSIGSINELLAQTPMIGEIRMFAGNFAPRGWAFCDGQILPILANQALYSLLGTTYGGDGRTTFALPDFRGRAPMHTGTLYRQGQKSGAEINYLTVQQMPSHNHNALIAVTSQSGNLLASTAGIIASHIGAFATTATPNETLTGGTVLNTGNNQAINNMQPYQVVNYIIALSGTFPSRN